MEPERWRQIERLYHAARERNKSECPAFLAKACAGDEDLRREVEFLLAKADQAGSFLESPAIEAEAKALAADGNLPDPSTAALEPGAMISHYRLTGKLGAGSMGEVYRARDTKLGRDVALKILPAAMALDAQRMARFEREARTLASLNHPKIAAIHDLEESNGIHTLVMELVEGPTLAERIAGAGLVPAHGQPRGSPLQESLGIARQIAEALEYAHEHGVIHRDLKPANVKITPEGTVKVLDFGLAKAAAPGFGPAPSEAGLKAVPTDASTLSTTATRAGTILGTAAYMSPEQAKGQPVDRRTDIWAFGCVLFEMLAGRRAFEGETISEVLAAVLMKEPDWNALPASTPVVIQKLVHHCLMKDPKQRLRDIGDARLAIEETLGAVATAVLHAQLPSETPLTEGGAEVSGCRRVPALAGRRRNLRWLAVVAVTTIAAIVVFGTLFALNVGGLRERLMAAVGAGHGVPFPKIESIAVLPLENLSADPEQEYIADGMTEELITDLGKIRALRVISRQSVMGYKGSKKRLPEIARELNVDAIVEGTVRRSGDRVRITANLLYAPTDRHMWAETYERDLGEVLALQSEVARAIAREVQAKLTPQERTGLARALPVNPQALDLYLKGRYYWNKRTPEALKKSLDCFQKAIEKDPNYAPAYAGLADSYAMLGAGFYAVLRPREAYPKAEAAATKALQLDSTLAQAHTTLAWSKAFFDWDWEGAEREFKRAIELNPGYANAYHWYAAFLSIMGRHSEAISEGRKAESLDPLSLIISADVAMEALGPAGLYDQEMEQCRKTLEMDASFPLAHACLSDSYKHKRMYDEAVTEMLKAIDLSGGSVVWVSALAQIYALAGKRSEAMKILNELNARSKREYVSPDLFAYIYASLGDNDQAFAWIEKAYEERSNLVSGLKSGRQLEPLRSDPRYQALLRRMNFPP